LADLSQKSTSDRDVKAIAPLCSLNVQSVMILFSGVVQVFHACFNEQGALTIVSARSVLEECDKRKDERTSVCGSRT
jgi:hypothetical protein